MHAFDISHQSFFFCKLGIAVAPSDFMPVSDFFPSKLSGLIILTLHSFFSRSAGMLAGDPFLEIPSHGFHDKPKGPEDVLSFPPPFIKTIDYALQGRDHRDSILSFFFSRLS